MPRGIVDQAAARGAAPAAALIKKNDAIFPRVEEATHSRLGACAGSAVEVNGRLPCRVATLFKIDAVTCVDAKITGAVWRNRWVQDFTKAHLCLWGFAFLARR